MTKVIWEKPGVPFTFRSPIPAGLLNPGKIHVWKAELDGWEPRLQEFFSLLSPAEKDRANRFRFSQHRKRFICAHAIQRLILAAYLSLPAAEIEIQTEIAGKPFLGAGSNFGDGALRFNLSHSDSLLLIALGKSMGTGVDVERIRPEYDDQVVSNHFFSPSEQSWLESLPLGQKKLAFFRLWTCKEAVLKAEGGGLRRNLGEVQIKFDDLSEIAQCSLEGKKEAHQSWSIRIFSPEPEYTAALAFEIGASAAVDPELIFYEWIG